MEEKFKIIFFSVLILFLTILSFLFDTFFLNFIPSLRIGFLNPPIIFLGSTFGLIIILSIISLFFILEKKYNYFFHFLVALILTTTICTLLKFLIMRPRPEMLPLLLKSSSSFPSTHAALGTIAFLFIRKLNRLEKIIFFLISLIIIFSGFYNGIHYLSDVFTGIFIGIILYVITTENKTVQTFLKKLSARFFPENT